MTPALQWSMRWRLPLDLSPDLVSYRRVLIVGAHLLLVPLAYFVAYAIRFDFRVPPAELRVFVATLPYLLAIRLAVYARYGLFRGYWRHVGLRDLVDLGVATTLSTAIFTAFLFVFGWPPALPRSVFVLDWLSVVFLSGGLRFVARAFYEGQLPLQGTLGTRRTLLIGAGEAAEMLLRQLQHDSGGRDAIGVVGLVDDNPETHGRSLHGVPVVGGTADLARLVHDYRIQLIVIAIRSATAEQMQRITATETEFKIIPSLQDLLDGRAGIGQLREVEIEDLLSREPVHLDLAQVRADLEGRSVLITGAGGSIGSELARQIVRFRPARLVLLERAESPLYFVNLELAATAVGSGTEVVPVIANITNFERLNEVFEAYQPDYVFHAAAYKHVPLMEDSVFEAGWNNVIGTLRVAQQAVRHGASKFVLISTDKAVNPTSMMGATKRIAERIVLELPSLRGETDFRVVRFGNVLGSDGSVVPLFKRQLAAGGPITVTHPEVQRYFMTIPEAVELVLTAAALPAAAGRISILEMGSPVRIVDLAEQLIRLSGLEPYKDVQIVFTGLRPGEKLNEELVTAGEETVPTSAEKIRLVERNGGSGAQVASELQRLVDALYDADVTGLMRAVAALAPEYTPPPARAPRHSPAAGVRRPTLLTTIPTSTPLVPVPAARHAALRVQRSLLGDASGA